MSSNKYLKVIADKWNNGRDLTDIRKRNSTRLRESRRSQRSKVINQLRQGLDLTEQRAVKKTAAEEKLERLKAYKAEKSKKMQEQNKQQKPPFCSVVKSRHTGGTPFRDTVRTRSMTRSLFEFKATLQDTKNGKNKTVASRVRNQHETKKPIVQVKKVNSQQMPSTSGVLRHAAVVKKTNATKETNVVEKKMVANKENTVIKPKRAVNNKQKVVQPPKIVSKSTKVEKVNGVPKENKQIINATREKKNLKGKQEKQQQETNKKLADVTNSVHAQSQNGSGMMEVTRQTRGTYTKSEDKNNTKINVKPQDSAVQETSCQKENQHDTEYEERKIGTKFHRTRLNDEINRLTYQSDTWSKRNEENIPEHIKDEILVVVGQTKLLLTQKFMDFKNLIDRCESIQTADDIKVTLQDLEGFWDMMYHQVIQLDQKYKNLQELESNQWQEPLSCVTPNKSKRVVRKRKSPIKKQVSSKFKEFLKSKQQPQTKNENFEVLSNQNQDVALAESKQQPQTKTENVEVLSSQNQDVTFAVVPGTPSILPDIQRTLTSERNSRRSSAGLIILRQRHLMKSISSPSKNNS